MPSTVRDADGKVAWMQQRISELISESGRSNIGSVQWVSRHGVSVSLLRAYTVTNYTTLKILNRKTVTKINFFSLSGSFQRLSEFTQPVFLFWYRGCLWITVFIRLLWCSCEISPPPSFFQVLCNQSDYCITKLRTAIIDLKHNNSSWYEKQ